MRVWIDLANSPHPLLFSPVARMLEERGHEVAVTARDHAQTAELSRDRWPDVAVIGGESPAPRIAKASAILGRVRALRRWAREWQPDLALSHNSYAQILAARSARLPVVTAMDFEHQPVNHLAFRLARTVLVPEAFPERAARTRGAGPAKLLRYPGLKESLYLGEVEPDPHVLDRLGLEGLGPTDLAVARTPPSRAVYHRLANPLFEECLRALDPAGTMTVVLPRHPEQAAAIERLSLSRCVIPRSAVDSRSLMRCAGLFIGAGGTMTREAALLGVPTVSVFAGEVPAVDRWLEERGLIARIRRVEDLPTPRRGSARSKKELEREAAPILERFREAVERLA